MMDVCDSKKVCILAVDDSHEFLHVIEGMVKTIPFYEVITVSSIEDARMVFVPDMFAVMIVDLMIDGTTQNTLEFLDDVRCADKNIILVLCTGYSSSIVEKDRLIMDSVDYFIEKPFLSKEFKAALFQWGFHYRERKENNSRIMEVRQSIERRLMCLENIGQQILNLSEA